MSQIATVLMILTNLCRLHKSDTIAIELTINPNNMIPESPKTEIIENFFGSDGCACEFAFAIRNEVNIPSTCRPNEIANHETSNFETFESRNSPFDWNVMENGMRPNTREIM